MFNLDNTTGYTKAQCDALNAEFDRRFAAGDWQIDREQAEKSFADEISHR